LRRDDVSLDPRKNFMPGAVESFGDHARAGLEAHLLQMP
jgi:hypothetical protein